MGASFFFQVAIRSLLVRHPGALRRALDRLR
jgi:hypothetical protein